MFDYQRVRARSPDRFSFLRCPYGGSIAGNNKHLATMTNAECGDNGCFKVFHGYSTWADATKWVLVKVWARTDPHMWYSCCSTKSTWSIMVGDGLPILTQMINLMFPKMWGTPNHPFIFILWKPRNMYNKNMHQDVPVLPACSGQEASEASDDSRRAGSKATRCGSFCGGWFNIIVASRHDLTGIMVRIGESSENRLVSGYWIIWFCPDGLISNTGVLTVIDGDVIKGEWWWIVIDSAEWWLMVMNDDD